MVQTQTMGRGSRLAGQIALVVGASSGIGKATALAFAREGASVGLVARREDVLTEVAGAIEAGGGRAFIQAADLRDGPATRAAVEAAIKHFGRLDVVVYAAGTNLPRER